MTFHSEIMNVVVLLAELWVCNSNVFGIGGKGPLGSFDAHANSVAIRERATNVEYRVPRFGAKRYLIPVLDYRRALVGILAASDEGCCQKTGHKNKVTHADKYSGIGARASFRFRRNIKGRPSGVGFGCMPQPPTERSARS